MASNREKIIAQYNQGNEQDRSARDRSTALEFHYTEKHLLPYVKATDKVLEVGCATGYYGFCFADKCHEYHGVDIVPLHIELFKKNIQQSGITNISCSVGDATNLEGIEDSSFDVVLCLGPMYHLPQEEREKCLCECRRVCKSGGILAFAYINKIGVYAGACVLDANTYPCENANEHVLNREEDDMKPDTFFYSTPEEINQIAENHGLCKLKNLGTDFFVTANAVNAMTDERFEIMQPLYDEMTSHESCTGMSNHALLICKKP